MFNLPASARCGSLFHLSLAPSALFQKAGTTAGLCSRKRDRSSFEPTVKAVTLDEEIVEWLQDGVSMLSTYRRPFDIIAEGPSPLNWLHRADEFRNYFLYENILETNPQFQAVELAIARM